MPKINIKTTQNVTISYELAKTSNRAFAFFLDTLTVWILIGIISLFVNIISPNLSKYALYAIIVPILVLYTLLWETIFNGQTLGKKILKMRVIRSDGQQLNFLDIAIRWAFRLVDIHMSLTIIGLIMINSSNKNQRLGGMLSGTLVVTKEPGVGQFSLESILTLNTKHYVPTYPEVKYFKEEEMILIKKTLNRRKLYKNKAHNRAVIQLAEKLAEKIKIETPPHNKKIEFLKILLNDYVMITR